VFQRTPSCPNLATLIEFCLLLGLGLLFSGLDNRAALAKARVGLPPQQRVMEELSTSTPTPNPTSPPLTTPTPTDYFVFSEIYTATQAITLTSTLLSVDSSTPAPTEITDSISQLLIPADIWPIIFLPIVNFTQIPTTSQLFCSQGSPVDIPDDDPDGITSSLQIDQPGIALDVNVYLNINHTWPGDLKAALIHQASGIRVDLIDQPGVPASSLGCGSARIQAILDDEASQPAENKCGSYPAGIAGIFQPASSLNQFHRQWTTGTWILEVSDHAAFDTGSLQKWCLEITSADPGVTPTPPPTPISLPSSAFVSGVTGKDQALPLDCESRSAVDWAKFFGSSIPELEFYNRLPHSDNPEKGFVGDVNGVWGNIPPGDYGIHAAPVAALLHDYGLDARAYHSLRWEDIQAEIASGNPVMVWITGHAYAGRYPSGAPQYTISTSDQNFTVVANYEHTVIVTGYTSSSVTILDGSSTYTRNLNEFLDSWSTLRNMAILAHP